MGIIQVVRMGRRVECGNSRGHICTFRVEVSNKRGLMEMTQLTIFMSGLAIFILLLDAIRVLSSPFFVFGTGEFQIRRFA